MIRDDGDIIKACGFLAIYFGNLEDELDALYAIAMAFLPELKAHEHLRFTEKSRHLLKALVRSFELAPGSLGMDEEVKRIKAILKHCKTVADGRNTILHSSIYAESDGRTVMKSKHSGTRTIESAEVYDQANEISDMNGAVFGLKFPVTRLRLVLEKVARRPGK